MPENITSLRILIFIKLPSYVHEIFFMDCNYQKKSFELAQIERFVLIKISIKDGATNLCQFGLLMN